MAQSIPFVAICGILACFLITIHAQCDIPSDWRGIWFKRQSNNPEIVDVQATLFDELSLGSKKLCEAENTTGNYSLIAFKNNRNSKRSCFEGFFLGDVILRRESTEVPPGNPFTVDECEAEQLGPRIRFKSMVRYTFDPTSWKTYTPSFPLAGKYKLEYDTQSCADPAAAMMITGNEWEPSSYCINGTQSYTTNPLAGQLLIVGAMSDSALSVGSSTKESGLMVVAMRDPTVPGPTGRTYIFWIFRYKTIQDGMVTKLQFFFVTSLQDDPVGFLDLSHIPTQEAASTVKFNFTSYADCTPAPCRNGATCLESFPGYVCRCPPGYDQNSHDCEVELDECESNPCQEGGTCTDLKNGYSCQCTTGFNGINCADVEKCDPNPCANGATCIQIGDDALCVCATGYVGLLCELENFCASDPCQNGGTCGFNDIEAYCYCPGDFTGDVCQTPIVVEGVCTDDLCLNGGRCELGPAGSYCQCTIYYEGNECEELSDWFIVTLVLAALTALFTLVLFILCCCCCCCGWRPNNKYSQMDNSESSFKMDTLPPATVEFNFSPATPTYGIQMIRR